jgi:NAD(P)H-hydrate epimerase
LNEPAPGEVERRNVAAGPGAHRNLRPLSRKELREVDRVATAVLGIPSLCLMENAGAGAARVALAMLAGSGEALCVCGPGGNGGDALVVARHLAIAGIRVAAICWGPRPRGDAAVQAAICGAMRIPMSRAEDPAFVAVALNGAARETLVVDGLYGTGLERPIEGPAAQVVEAVNSSGLRVLALDVPSGLDCDSGRPMGACIRAAHTATFVAPKIGFGNPASRAWTGEVTVVPIGAPADPPAPG